MQLSWCCKGRIFYYIQDRIVQGFDIFKEDLKAKRQRNDNLSLERFYVQLCDKFNCDETAVFRDLFEYVNLHTYSEALCETIGSLMLLAFSSGRGLHPPNLNKEICIRYHTWESCLRRLGTWLQNSNLRDTFWSLFEKSAPKWLQNRKIGSKVWERGSQVPAPFSGMVTSILYSIILQV